jgi:hypothetical protein
MRAVRTIAALLLVLLAFEGAARWLEPRIPEPVTWSNPFAQAKYRQLEDLAATGGAEIVFLGSSIVNANIDAAAIGTELGTTAYNAGLPSSNIPLWDEYLRTVVLDLACPTVVVIGVGIRDSNDNLPGFDNYVPAYRASVGRRELTGELSLLERIETWAADISAFVRLRPRLREPGNVFAWLRTGRAPGWTEKDLDEAGRYLGFVDDPNRAQEQVADVQQRVFADYSVGGRQFDALIAAATAAREHGAQVVLLDLPSMETLTAKALPNGRSDLDAYHAAVDHLAEHLDAPLFRAPAMNDAEDFYADLYHMNERGARVLSAQLSAWLADQDLGFGSRSGCATG